MLPDLVRPPASECKESSGCRTVPEATGPTVAPCPAPAPEVLVQQPSCDVFTCAQPAQGPILQQGPMLQQGCGGVGAAPTTHPYCPASQQMYGNALQQPMRPMMQSFMPAMMPMMPFGRGQFGPFSPAPMPPRPPVCLDSPAMLPYDCVQFDGTEAHKQYIMRMHAVQQMHRMSWIPAHGYMAPPQMMQP
eukprot:SAG22_NODE_9772_length_570_cov_1.093418_1_plen_189_part_11